jgi:hypothetical protein
MEFAKSRTANAASVERDPMGKVDQDKRWPKWTLLFNHSPKGTRWNTRVFAFYDDEKIAKAEYERLAALDKRTESHQRKYDVNDTWIFCPTLRRFHHYDIPHMDAGGGIPSPRAKAQELLDELRAGANGDYWWYGVKKAEGLPEFVKRLNEFKLPQV